MNNKNIYFCLIGLLLLAFGCDNNKDDSLRIIGCSAEKIYWKDDSTHLGSVEIDTFVDEHTKCYLVSTIKKSFQNARFELFSSENNLMMALGLCSEVGYPVGYKFSYDSLGRTERVSWVEMGGGHSIDEYDGEYNLKEMLRLYFNNDSLWSMYDIIRDSSGNVVRIGDIDDCHDYDLSYGVYDGANYWESDLSGGDIHFIVVMKYRDRSMKNATIVDRYYVDGKLAVEAAYWNSKLIKCLTYKRNGSAGYFIDNKENPLNLCLHGYSSFDGVPWYLK